MNAIDPAIAGQLAAELPPEVFAMIIQTFEADAAQLLSALGAAAQAGDADAWHKAAHGLAGAAGGVGATRLEALAREAMRPADPPAAAAAARIGEAAREALAALNRLSAGPG